MAFECYRKEAKKRMNNETKSSKGYQEYSGQTLHKQGGGRVQ